MSTPGTSQQMLDVGVKRYNYATINALLQFHVVGIFSRITEKPWLPTDDRIERLHTGSVGSHNRKVALIVFLCVVGSVFFLLFAATHMRKVMAVDWVPMPEPGLIWINSLVLVGVSFAFEIARSSANATNLARTRNFFLLAGVGTLVFIVLQFIAWQQLLTLNYGAKNNPANAFFYLLTAAHAVHLLGGLVAWWRAMRHMRHSRKIEYSKIRTSVGLCAIYWHFLLFIWVAMVALFVTT